MPSAPVLPQYIAQGLDYPLTYTQSGAGQPLLLIHGSLCDYRYWRWQIPAFSNQVHVIAPSLRGYWPNAFQTESAAFSVAQHTRDLINFVRSRREPMHVLGHSRGAHIALELACAVPELTRSLILADPGFSLPGHPKSHSFQFEVVEKLKRGDLEGALTQFIDTVNGPGTWRQMVSWFKTMVKDNAYTLLSQINEVDAYFDLSCLQKIDMPVLLLGGANSPDRYRRRLDVLEELLTQAQRVTVPLAAHGMNLANPRAFNEQVLLFLVQHAQMRDASTT
ncbi:MAG: alpha/beta hydrolase [Burkholderiaceae bacterium]